jgi:hypothetical protein
MTAKLEYSSGFKLSVDKTERNSMLLLEFLEERQVVLPQLKLVTHTQQKDIVHGDNSFVFKCRIYLAGEIASKVIYEQFKDYINNNQT